MNGPNFIPLPHRPTYSEEEMIARAKAFFEEMAKRRTVREFSGKDVPPEVIKYCIRAAGTAPSGANLQPWSFVVVLDPHKKKQIREAAEIEEREFYESRAPEEWLEALAPLGTSATKPFLETAPYLIVIFYEPYGISPGGRKLKHYYALESVGIATGLLITALHTCGLATLTHTPSPMRFLNEVLERPQNERPFLLLVVGYPDENARVPEISKKDFSEIASFI